MLDFVTNIIGVRVLLILIAILSVLNVYQGVELKIQRSRVDVAEAKNTVLGDKLTTQNQAIEDWKQTAIYQAQTAREAALKAEKIRTVTVERVQTVTLAAVPVSCPEAIKWGSEQAIEFNKRWEEEE